MDRVGSDGVGAGWVELGRVGMVVDWSRVVLGVFL